MNQEIIKSDFEIRVEKLTKSLVQKNLAYGELLRLYANSLAIIEETSKERDKWKIEAIKLVDSMESLVKDTYDDFENSLEILAQKIEKIKIEQEETIKQEIRTYKKKLAIKGATERLKVDPKQKAKKEIYKDYWIRWKKNPTLYPSKAAFARDMQEKFLCLTNVKSIESWCTKWSKET